MMPMRSIITFFVITFVVTWGLLGFYVFFPGVASASFGELSGTHPLFFLATWAPALSAFVVVFLYAGRAGVRAFLSRLLLWRCSIVWLAFILIGLPLVFILGSLMQGGPALAPLPADGMSSLLTTLGIMLLLGPVEEFGWRGVAQPLLQRHLAPIWAGILIGSIWGVWHLPAFFLSGTVFAGWSFLPFFFGSVVLAVLVTPLFNSSRGSIFLPMLFHWQLVNPFWPDAQPWDTWLLAALAVIVAWWHRDTMFSRAGAVIEVVPTTSRS